MLSDSLNDSKRFPGSTVSQAAWVGRRNIGLLASSISSNFFSIIETQRAFRTHFNITTNRFQGGWRTSEAWEQLKKPRSIRESIIVSKNPRQDSPSYRDCTRKPQVFSTKTCDISRSRHVWGFLKARVSFVSYGKIDDLKDSIRQEIEAISPETLRKVRASFQNCIQACMDSNGAHMPKIVFKILGIKMICI